MSTPEQILEHSTKFKDGTWRNYSYEELAQWVNLLTKRAGHRTDIRKAEKDLDDANNYLMMLNAKFTEQVNNVLTSFQQEE